jgi:hypothetical protein
MTNKPPTALRVAAITTAWNESMFLPLWLRHYGHHLGAENLFVIDNDSDDGTTVALGASSRIRYPRGPYDDVARVVYVSQLINAIRLNYDAVIIADCDEFLVPDPKLYGSLKDFIAATPGDALMAIGLNVHHMLTEEAPFDPARPLFEQRRHVQFVSPMCKPAITRKDVAYSPGFHNSSLRPVLGALYNFHLRWVDCGYTLKRLHMTRTMQWKDSSSWHYQRQPDEDTLNHFLHIKKLERRAPETFTFSEDTERLYATLVKNSGDGRFVIAQDVRNSYLNVLPEYFSGAIL